MPPVERVVPRLLSPSGFWVCTSFGTKLVFRGESCKSLSLLDRDLALAEIGFGRALA